MNLSSVIEMSPKNLALRNPFVITTPYSGTGIPDDLKPFINPEYHYTQPDVDWLLHRFWEFSTDLGATVVFPFLSQYVIDLTADPKDVGSDQKLLLTKTSTQKAIYSQNLDFAAEKIARVELYYAPFHRRLTKVLEQVKNHCGFAVLVESYLLKNSSEIIMAEPVSLTDTAQRIWNALQNCQAGVKLKMMPHASTLGRIYQEPNPAIHSCQIFIGDQLFLRHGQFLDREIAKTHQQSLHKLFSAFSG